MTEPLMDDPLDALDHRILQELQVVHRQLDPPPQDLAERLKFVLTLAALEAEVADLQQLSDAGVRSDQGYAVCDTLTFTSSSLSLMVTVTAETDDAAGQPTVRVDGWLTGGGVDVELSVGGHRYPATSDVHGRLIWQGVSRGRARFLIRPATEGAKPVVTPTIDL